MHMSDMPKSEKDLKTHHITGVIINKGHFILLIIKYDLSKCKQDKN